MPRTPRTLHRLLSSLGPLECVWLAERPYITTDARRWASMKGGKYVWGNDSSPASNTYFDSWSAPGGRGSFRLNYPNLDFIFETANTNVVSLTSDWPGITVVFAVRPANDSTLLEIKCQYGDGVRFGMSDAGLTGTFDAASGPGSQTSITWTRLTGPIAQVLAGTIDVPNRLAAVYRNGTLMNSSSTWAQSGYTVFPGGSSGVRLGPNNWTTMAEYMSIVVYRSYLNEEAIVAASKALNIFYNGALY